MRRQSADFSCARRMRWNRTARIGGDERRSPTQPTSRGCPGLIAAALAAAAAWGIHWLVPAIPLLTAAVALGIIVGQLPFARPALTGSLAPGLAVASRRLMRIGVVLLGLKLSLVDIANLGWVTILTTVAIVLLTFVGTIGLGRLFRLPGHQPLLVATGFSICGASAIGAMSGVVRAKDEETATPVALVTLCGTLAIFVLPVFWHPLGLTNVQFGHWVGAGVHDVGQVVATAQIAGTGGPRRRPRRQADPRADARADGRDHVGRRAPPSRRPRPGREAARRSFRCSSQGSSRRCWCARSSRCRRRC